MKLVHDMSASAPVVVGACCSMHQQCSAGGACGADGSQGRACACGLTGGLCLCHVHVSRHRQAVLAGQSGQLFQPVVVCVVRVVCTWMRLLCAQVLGLGWGEA